MYLYLYLLSSGITEDNIDDVQWCVRTSDQAKSIRLAARKLYSELGGGREGCSKDEYVQRVQALTAERREKKFLLSTGWLHYKYTINIA